MYQNTPSTLPQFCQLAELWYCIGLSEALILHLFQKIPLQQRKCDKEGNGEDSVCRLEELEAVCFLHSCHSPFEKCIKAIVKLVGVGMGTQSHDHPPNLSGEDGREPLLTLSNAPLCHIIITSTMTDHGNIESCHFCDWFVLPRTETICFFRAF